MLTQRIQKTTHTNSQLATGSDMRYMQDAYKHETFTNSAVLTFL
jgi:hypothetical protein